MKSQKSLLGALTHDAKEISQQLIAITERCGVMRSNRPIESQIRCRYATNLVSLRLKSSTASSDATISPPALDKRAKSARGTSC